VIVAMAVASCAQEKANAPPRTTSSDEGTCVTYGFVPGTTGYTG